MGEGVFGRWGNILLLIVRAFVCDRYVRSRSDNHSCGVEVCVMCEYGVCASSVSECDVYLLCVRGIHVCRTRLGKSCNDACNLIYSETITSRHWTLYSISRFYKFSKIVTMRKSMPYMRTSIYIFFGGASRVSHASFALRRC